MLPSRTLTTAVLSGRLTVPNDPGTDDETATKRNRPENVPDGSVRPSRSSSMVTGPAVRSIGPVQPPTGASRTRLPILNAKTLPAKPGLPAALQISRIPVPPPAAAPANLASPPDDITLPITFDPRPMVTSSSDKMLPLNSTPSPTVVFPLE